TNDSGCFPRASMPLRQIVRSRVHWRWHTLPRLALLRRNRGVDVFEQPVRTLVLGPLKLGWTQHSNGFRSALDDRSARRSPALQHLSNRGAGPPLALHPSSSSGRRTRRSVTFQNLPLRATAIATTGSSSCWRCSASSTITGTGADPPSAYHQRSAQVRG